MTSDNSPVRSRRQWEALARSRLRQGDAAGEVEEDFVEEGLEPDLAAEIVDEALRSARASAIRMLIGGAVVAAGGMVVTLASLFFARTGEMFVIWFGPIVCGGIVALIGFVRLMSIRL